MKRRITFLTAAFVLLAFLAVPLGMRGQAPVGTTLWAEDFSGYAANDVPSGDITDHTGTTVYGNGTITYSVTNGGGTTKIYGDALAGGTAPELLVAKGGGTWTIAGIPTGNAVELTLTYKTNNGNNTISSTTEGVTITEETSRASTKIFTIATGGASQIALVITNSASGNTRVDDFSLVVKTPEGGTPMITYTVTYNANVAGVNPVVDTYNEGANVTLRPANTFNYEGHTFSEWNTQADGDGVPYDAGDVIENIQENLEFYAIWIEDTPSDEQWVLTNLADLTENDVFVIVGNNGSNYAMPNNNGTSSAPTAVAVTIANNGIIGTVDATIQWNISGDASNGYTFYPNGSTETWLYCTNTNNGVRVGTNDNKTFVFNSDYLYNSATGRHIGIYNSQDWRCYLPSSTGVHNNIAGQTFAFYKKVTGGIVPPSISAENVEIAYDATTGSIAYTINNSVDGGTLTAVTESDWLTLGQGTTSPISFTCPANEAGTERTATVTLTYTYNRATATANVTVTQAGNPNITQTIAEVRAQGTGAVVTQGTVTSITGSSNKTAYIQDATAAIVVYGNFSATVGDEIRVSGTLSDYNGLLEITSPQVTLISSGNSITPELMTVAEVVASTNQGWYIRVEEATVTAISGSGSSQNTTIAQGDNTIVVRGNLGITVAVNNIISLDGNIGYFNVNQIANPQNVEVQQILVPFITVTPATVNVDADLHAEGLAIAYENIEITSYQDFAVQFYDAEGEETDMPDWLVAMVTGVIGGDPDEYQLTCAIINNEGEARSAYMKVYAYDAENNVVYSNLVTVNQAEYVAPTYAELPFEFDGGKAAIDTIDGFYQEGLDSDYGSSPKLKFNSTGDYVLLQFNEMPGPLFFDIKGNSFGGGTFTVQTSEDGVIYTDLATYTELSATQHESFNNLGENVRYIKWIYTEKVSGNVALGNIYLYEFGGGPVIETYDLTVEPFENLEIYTFVGNDEPVLEGAGIIQVAEGDNVMLSITPNEGYVIQSLMVDGEEHVNDISNAATYTFAMPAHNVTVSATAAPVVPFEPATYTLATTIESGKTYIIVGAKENDSVTNYYAMGEQRNNNRGGYAISVDGTTATVETADVHEFVITALDQPGFYSIYDNGYLYAASNNSNHLKTLDTLNVNGEWEISINDTTGWFSVVASNSSNRNVMQFNGMGSNALFSCYGTASQSPVYLYVKDEVPSTVTQTIALTEGYNWVSFNKEIVLNDLKAALIEAAPAGTEIMIKSKTQNATYNPNNGRWSGRLNTLDLSQMYFIKVEGPCEISLQGFPVDPADHPVTVLGNGQYTFIAFPFDQSMTLTDAFAGFAVQGDMIKSKSLNAQYNRRWQGQLNTLEPGQGYKYKSSNSAANRTLVFPNPTRK